MSGAQRCTTGGQTDQPGRAGSLGVKRAGVLGGRSRDGIDDIFDDGPVALGGSDQTQFEDRSIVYPGVRQRGVRFEWAVQAGQRPLAGCSGRQINLLTQSVDHIVDVAADRVA